jgi:branched-chain amino acid transport system permease protein
LTGLGVSGEMHGPWLLAVVLVTVLASMLLCGIVGMLIERLAYRRLRNAPRLAPLITAIGMSFILENIMQLWRGPSPVPFPKLFPIRRSCCTASIFPPSKCSSSPLRSS